MAGRSRGQNLVAPAPRNPDVWKASPRLQASDDWIALKGIACAIEVDELIAELALRCGEKTGDVPIGLVRHDGGDGPRMAE
jgi:hypothetical protein